MTEDDAALEDSGYMKDPELAKSLNGMWWCNSHGRQATYIHKNRGRCCDPKLGGIMLPCFVVFVPAYIETK